MTKSSPNLIYYSAEAGPAVELVITSRNGPEGGIYIQVSPCEILRADAQGDQLVSMELGAKTVVCVRRTEEPTTGDIEEIAGLIAGSAEAIMAAYSQSRGEAVRLIAAAVPGADSAPVYDKAAYVRQTPAVEVKPKAKPKAKKSASKTAKKVTSAKKTKDEPAISKGRSGR